MNRIIILPKGMKYEETNMETDILGNSPKKQLNNGEYQDENRRMD